MARVTLDCSKAFEKLKGGYRFIITKDSAVVAVRNVTHVNPQGSHISMLELVRILSTVNPTNGAPARPFFVDFSRNVNKELLQLIKDNLTVKKVKSTSPAYLADIYITLNTDNLAKMAVAMIKTWMLNGTYYRAHAPNAPFTINKKGHDLPLFETGQLINSIVGHTKVGK